MAVISPLEPPEILKGGGEAYVEKEFVPGSAHFDMRTSGSMVTYHKSVLTARPESERSTE